MGRRIAVLGAGAIGSSVSADLIEAGHEITVIDQWPAQVEAIRSTGLTVRMPDHEARVMVPALHLCELASARKRFEIVFMAVKGYDHRWMAELIAPFLEADGVLVGVQNGMNDDSIASIVGRERTVGCVVELSAEIFTPGLVQRNTSRKGTWFALGELDTPEITPRVRELAGLLGCVGRVDIASSIRGAKWTKLIANSMTMGPRGLLGLPNGEASKLPGMAELALRAGKESMAVGRAMGLRVEPVFGLRSDDFAGDADEVLSTAMTTLLGHVGGRSRTAPIQDHLKGRRSEMEYITGLVCRKGRELGVATPVNDAVIDLYRRIDSGELVMDPSNYDRLRARLEAGTSD
jgi:2-dehydropantoate 2-reductase